MLEHSIGNRVWILHYLCLLGFLYIYVDLKVALEVKQINFLIIFGKLKLIVFLKSKQKLEKLQIDQTVVSFGLEINVLLPVLKANINRVLL